MHDVRTRVFFNSTGFLTIFAYLLIGIVHAERGHDEEYQKVNDSTDLTTDFREAEVSYTSTPLVFCPCMHLSDTFISTFVYFNNTHILAAFSAARLDQTSQIHPSVISTFKELEHNNTEQINDCEANNYNISGDSQKNTQRCKLFNSYKSGEFTSTKISLDDYSYKLQNATEKEFKIFAGWNKSTTFIPKFEGNIFDDDLKSMNIGIHFNSKSETKNPINKELFVPVNAADERMEINDEERMEINDDEIQLTRKIFKITKSTIKNNSLFDNHNFDTNMKFVTNIFTPTASSIIDDTFIHHNMTGNKYGEHQHSTINKHQNLESSKTLFPTSEIIKIKSTEDKIHPASMIEQPYYYNYDDALSTDEKITEKDVGSFNDRIIEQTNFVTSTVSSLTEENFTDEFIETMNNDKNLKNNITIIHYDKRFKIIQSPKQQKFNNYNISLPIYFNENFKLNSSMKFNKHDRNENNQSADYNNTIIIQIPSNHIKTERFTVFNNPTYKSDEINNTVKSILVYPRLGLRNNQFSNAFNQQRQDQSIAVRYNNPGIQNVKYHSVFEVNTEQPVQSIAVYFSPVLQSHRPSSVLRKRTKKPFKTIIANVPKYIQEVNFHQQQVMG